MIKYLVCESPVTGKRKPPSTFDLPLIAVNHFQHSLINAVCFFSPPSQNHRSLNDQTWSEKRNILSFLHSVKINISQVVDLGWSSFEGRGVILWSFILGVFIIVLYSLTDTTVSSRIIKWLPGSSFYLGHMRRCHLWWLISEYRGLISWDVALK